MPIATRDLYRSANGDRWLLIRDDTGRVFVRHEANLAAGSTVTDSEIGDFLRQDGPRPGKAGTAPADRLFGRLQGYVRRHCRVTIGRRPPVEPVKSCR